MRRDIEGPIHKSILAYLVIVLRVHGNKCSPVFHVPNGGNRSAIEGRKMKDLGARAGFPDLAFLFESNLYTLEIKPDKGKQSKVQKDWEKYITDAGGYYEIVRSIDETKDVLIKWGIL